ncbi:prefoldin subunit 5 [Halyomorpha halys]|uniref:prefoldin subunit 5 n=1 Tax=Halyomorpha halys TaxID=286706 RepID=UPI0006D4C878|nr:prefoldin subunit 5 [Halyomorpha halys]
MALALIKRELSQRIRILKDEQTLINKVQDRFQNDYTALKTLEGKSLPFKSLVPLTNRIFVPGKVEEVELLYHAGDGYFFTKSLQRAERMAVERWKNLQKKLNRYQLMTILIQSIWTFAHQIKYVKRRMELDGASDEKKAEVEKSLFALYKNTISIFNGDVPEEFFDDM